MTVGFDSPGSNQPDFDIPALSLLSGLSESQLIEQAILRREGQLGMGGTLLVNTGFMTGRSPQDKYIADPETGSDPIWRGGNRMMSTEHFERLRRDMYQHMASRELFVQDLAACADPEFQVVIRVVTELAWHSLFIRHLLRQATEDPEPEFLIVNCPSFSADPERHGCRSKNVVAISFEKRVVLIAGTGYSGEIKKSVFTLLNRILPERGVVSMHCSANHALDDPDDSAIFFGLSGTGKTTLSSVSERALIGDDEHGWSDTGIFNIEGGCYAKTLNLDPAAEPEIYGTTSQFGTVIENMKFDPQTLELDFADSSITENIRCAYPLESIPGASVTGRGGHPKNLFMLTCDAFGVLPPISRLTPEQAIYQFLSGFTSKVAGTEQGISHPLPVFSACFGSPFLPLRPEVYGKLLRRRIEDSKADCWLVNTGWTGGGYGIGQRMPIGFTRALLNAALNGKLARVEFCQDPEFGLAIPVAAAGVPHHLLLPKRSWQDPAAYDASAAKVKALFAENFRHFEARVDPDVAAAAIST